MHRVHTHACDARTCPRVYIHMRTYTHAHTHAHTHTGGGTGGKGEAGGVCEQDSDRFAASAGGLACRISNHLRRVGDQRCAGRVSASPHCTCSHTHTCTTNAHTCTHLHTKHTHAGKREPTHPPIIPYVQDTLKLPALDASLAESAITDVSAESSTQAPTVRAVTQTSAHTFKHTHTGKHTHTHRTPRSPHRSL